MLRLLSPVIVLLLILFFPKWATAACTGSTCDLSSEAFGLCQAGKDNLITEPLWQVGTGKCEAEILSSPPHSWILYGKKTGKTYYSSRFAWFFGERDCVEGEDSCEPPEPPDCPGGINSDPVTGACACEDGYAPDYDANLSDNRNCDRPTPDCLQPFVDANGVNHCGINNQDFCDNNPTDPVCDHFNPDPDDDGDGIPNDDDTCPNDATNTCNDPTDDDGDGIPNDDDNCPNDATNTCNIVDTDGDGTPDDADPCPNDAFNQCTPPEEPQVDTHDPTDTDGDGTPNHSDPDIDGDGTPNSSDNDIDGDGVDNADDPEPNGEEGGGSAGASGQCDTKPECTGDPVNCAILDQVWLDTCKAEHEGDNLADTLEALKNYAPTDGEGQLLDLNKGEVGLGDLAGDYLNQTGAGGSCPNDLDIPLSIGTVSLPYTFLCNFASTLSGLVVIIFGFISARIVYRGLIS